MTMAEEEALELFSHKTEAGETDEEKEEDTLQKYQVKCIINFSAILALLSVGIVFLMIHEQWEFVDALYFCVVTSSTVGYGDMPLKNDSTRLFILFYVLFSVTLLAFTLGNLSSMRANYAVECRRAALDRKPLDTDEIRKWGFGGVGVGKHQFFVEMLLHRELVSSSDIEMLEKQFDEIDVDRNGRLFDDDLDALEEAEDRRVEASEKRQLEMDRRFSFNRYFLETRALSSSRRHRTRKAKTMAAKEKDKKPSATGGEMVVVVQDGGGGGADGKPSEECTEVETLMADNENSGVGSEGVFDGTNSAVDRRDPKKTDISSAHCDSRLLCFGW